MNFCSRIGTAYKEFSLRLIYSWNYYPSSKKISIALTISLVGLGMIAAAITSFVGFLGLDGLFDCTAFVYNFSWYIREFSTILSLSENGLALAFLLIGVVLLLTGLLLLPTKSESSNSKISNSF